MDGRKGKNECERMEEKGKGNDLEMKTRKI